MSSITSTNNLTSILRFRVFNKVLFMYMGEGRNQTPNAGCARHLPAFSWAALVPLPPAVLMGCGRTVAMEVAGNSLTIPEFGTPPLALFTLTALLFTAVGLFELLLFKLDWNVMEYLKAQVTNMSYYTLIFYKLLVINIFFP